MIRYYQRKLFIWGDIVFCFNCGTELSKGAKYCAKCGSKAVTMSCMGNTVQLKCKSCDGTLFVDEEREILQCPYCGSSELLIESDEVTIERIKQKSKKAIEFKRLDTNKELELEKLYYKEKRQQRQNDQAWKNLPKVWGFLIVLIIGFVLFMGGLNLLAKIEGNVSAPGAATELVGKNYLVV